MHAVVTGAGTGIGQAIAERLARDGLTLTLLARDVERLAAVAEPIGATARGCDIRDRADVDAAFAAAADEHGPIHVLVANAGIGGPRTSRGDGDRFDDLVATNLIGTYSCLRAAQRHFAARHGAAPPGRDLVHPGAHRGARLHRLQRVEGGAPRAGAVAGGGARRPTTCR